MLHVWSLLQPEPLSLWQASADCASAGDIQTLKGSSGSVSVGSLGPGARKVLIEPSKHLWQVWGLILKAILPPTILLGLLLCPWMWGIFFWWDPTFSCVWLFSSKLQFCCSHRRRWVHVLLNPACTAPEFSLSPGVCLCPFSWWCHLMISFSVALFCLQSFLASIYPRKG